MILLRYSASLVFIAQMYLAMLLLGIAFTPWAVLDRRGASTGIRVYCRYVRLTARLICGLRSEVRGTVPSGEVLVASKHQSFFDIILLCSVLPSPKFIMKTELRRAPVLGWYAGRIGCVPVDRGQRGQAINQMLADVAAGRSLPGQLVIYPQGTRVAPGDKRPYKIGTAVLYAESGQACVPAATNVGLFWPRRGILRRPGLAVVEFLPPIAPGLPTQVFMQKLESTIEEASDRLALDTGMAIDSDNAR
ncbi:1-acyl-sn-glycerol-3-phosphate acyltransferase [Meridianimarinicoccus roseus]|uniref:1-acyl-sn-glycerol-3-phosphate acyltransferase n=1 Tax=Meridianimarinicoccus roseus TaxID=2072018 RepID=A0A2V2LEC4_9RHOB|nr:lysophospholipid acyltransferase family protein [Meridianimarinicoccus roseus]PWR03910.1 1-acyl-sn-glycerol-3-phosphate acyltransferase [Meridianimarinicoccus roseus]